MSTSISAKATWAMLPVAAALLAPPGSAVAQETEAIVLDEIVVTAQRRQVDIQEAAVAVSVLSGEDFDRANVVKLDNFNGYVPGLTIAKNDGAGRVANIRGVGWETAQNLSTQPSVLLYMDGVYIANPIAMGTDLGDIERVEVFRGPQGFEFGQGTTGGAINLIMKKPNFDGFAGDVSLGAGTYSTLQARGAVNIPLGDNAAIRASVQKYTRDGFAEISRSSFPSMEGGAPEGYELDDADSLTAKVSLLWEPNDDWSVYLSAFLQDSDQNAAAQKNVNDPNPDKRKLSQDFPGIFELRNNAFSAALEWELTPSLVLKSITGYQELRKGQSVDGDRLNEDLIAIDLVGFGIFSNWDVLTFWENDSDAFSQELSLTYSGDRIDWVVGGYYLDHENFNDFLEATRPSPFSACEAALADPNPITLPPTFIDFTSCLNFVEARTVTREDLAGFAQVDVKLGDSVTARAGVRYQDEEQLDEAIQWFDCLQTYFGPVPCPVVDTLKDDKTTWKVGLDYNVSENTMIYGLVSTGWKNGGSNPGAILGGALRVPIAFLPEEVTSYEIGARNTLADGRVRLNLTAFFYDYENLQFMQEDPIPFAAGTGNIPETDIQGLETEFSVLFAEGWQLDGHLTVMDGEFTQDFFALDVVDFREALQSFVVGLFLDPTQAFRISLNDSTNLNGNEPPKLVDLTARLALTNERTLAGGSVFTSRLEYIHRGEYQYRVWNNPLVDTVPSYDILNLYFDYDPANAPWGVSVGLMNISDEDGVNARFSNPFGVLQTSEEFIPPFEAIATFRYEF
ncbi:MAG: TonB-dependent receptor [Woeseia sp.]